MKTLLFTKLSLLALLLSLSSCFSTYPIQKKFPCQETSVQDKLKMIEDAYNSRMKPKKLVVTEKGVQNKKKSYDFENIKFVRVQKKPGPLYLSTKWFIQIREFNGEMNVIYSRDHQVIEKANNALMCLTDLQDTNGRPKKNMDQTTPTTNKYDELEKLKSLLDTGAITQEEYETEKLILLSK